MVETVVVTRESKDWPVEQKEIVSHHRQLNDWNVDFFSFLFFIFPVRVLVSSP